MKVARLGLAAPMMGSAIAPECVFQQTGTIIAGVLGQDKVIRGEVRFPSLPGRVGAFTAIRP
jgi:hypothetical protein